MQLDTGRADDGSVLKNIRKLRGITRAELAEKAGISLSHLDKIEAGLRTPGLKTWQKILSALDADVTVHIPDTTIQEKCAAKAQDILLKSTDAQAGYLIMVLECMSDNIDIIL